MAHTMALSDEQYARLEAAAAVYGRSVNQVLADLLASLPTRNLAVSPEEYDTRWADFMRLVGSIQDGAPLTNEQIDELIGEEAAETHATDGGSSDAS